MKQKYALLRDDSQQTLVIREYAELDKEMMSLLCEESYADKDIENAMAQGQEALIEALRTHNMYPPAIYAVPIAEAIVGLYSENANPSAELFFDDKDLFIKEVEEEPEVPEEDLDEDVEVDDILDDAIDDDYDGKKILKDVKTGLKVADADGDSGDVGS